MPMHHRVLLAAHDGSLGVVRVIRVQKGGVTIETITQVSFQREKERERERERDKERERERERETERDREQNQQIIDRINRHLHQTMHAQDHPLGCIQRLRIHIEAKVL